MKLTLTIDGKKKTFSQPAKLTALTFKKAVKLAYAFEHDFSPELIELCEEFIATELYSNKFTAEQLSEGLELDGYIMKLMELVMSPVNRAKGHLDTVKN